MNKGSLHNFCINKIYSSSIDLVGKVRHLKKVTCLITIKINEFSSGFTATKQIIKQQSIEFHSKQSNNKNIKKIEQPRLENKQNE